MVLGHAEGRRGAEHAGLLLRRQAEGHYLAAVGVGQGLAHEPKPLHIRKAAGAELLLEPPRAQQLHRPSADHGRPRMRGEPRLSLHHEHLDAVAAQCRGRGQPRRARANHQYIDLLS